MILDYSSFIKYEATKGIVNDKPIKKSIELFYAQDGICPFCNTKAETRVNNSKHDTPEWLFGTFDEYETVYQCPSCGWWEYIYQNQSDAIIDGIRASDKEKVASVLKKYDITDKRIPTEVLSNYIDKNPSKIHAINPTAMELLVKSVFKDFYSCEVHHIGKSHDGGIDLLLIQNDNPTIIQVKRREFPNSVEPVKTIRELLGVSYFNDSKSCIFVSTADHFSKQAEKFANQSISKGKVDSFELINRENFLSMLNLTKKDVSETWKQFIKLH